jgi:hypothetical protein
MSVATASPHQRTALKDAGEHLAQEAALNARKA